MAEEAAIAFKSKALLRFKELFFETCAAAEGYYGLFSYHNLKVRLFTEASQFN